ncbi:MAG: hypothetical protein JXB46_06075 [Candidatus Eisenbacteria bacterium]|nr:hypothetical protein [Candidatus Eisenbacteria bacterium]
MRRRAAVLVLGLALPLLVLAAWAPCAWAQEREERPVRVLKRAPAVAESTSTTTERVERAPEKEAQKDPYLVGARLEPVRGVERALKGFTDFALPAVVTLAGIGLLVMAFIQLLKDLLPTREAFQRIVFRRYFRSAIDEMIEMNLELPTAEERTDPAVRLARLATAGSVGALFSLPVEKFAGQLNVAMQTVMENPSEHSMWIRILARYGDSRDVEKVISAGRTLRSEVSDAKPGQVFADDREVIEARSRVTNEIQRSLDRIQVLFSHQWQRFLKWVSFILGFCIILFGVRHYVPGAFHGANGWLIWLVIAAVGGFLAPVARDLMAALQSVRRLGRE